MYPIVVTAAVLISLLHANPACNDCTLRKSIDMNFLDIDETYYLLLYLNEIHKEARTSCIKITFKSDKKTSTLHETVQMVYPGSNNVTTTYLTNHFRSPGILESASVINGTTISFLDYIMEFTKGQSLISSVCQKNDGIKYTDKIAVFFTTRNVGPDVILAKLRSVGISGSEPNTDYYFVPQFMCPN